MGNYVLWISRRGHSTPNLVRTNSSFSVTFTWCSGGAPLQNVISIESCETQKRSSNVDPLNSYLMNCSLVQGHVDEAHQLRNESRRCGFISVHQSPVFAIVSYDSHADFIFCHSCLCRVGQCSQVHKNFPDDTRIYSHRWLNSHG